MTLDEKSREAKALYFENLLFGLEHGMYYDRYDMEGLTRRQRKVAKELTWARNQKAKINRIKLVAILGFVLTAASIVLSALFSTLGLSSLSGGAGGLIALFGIVTICFAIYLCTTTTITLDTNNKRIDRKSTLNIFDSAISYLEDELADISEDIIKKDHEDKLKKSE
jgi:hypothetical protein